MLEDAEAESLESFARRVEQVVQLGMPVGDLLAAYPAASIVGGGSHVLIQTSLEAVNTGGPSAGGTYSGW